MFLTLSKSGFFNTAKRITTLARVKTRDCVIYNLTYPGSRHLSTISSNNLVFSYKIPSRLKYYKRLTHFVSCYSEWPVLLNCCGLRLLRTSVSASSVNHIVDSENDSLQVHLSYRDSWSSTLWTIFDIFCTILRALVHLVTFLPVIILYPLTYFSPTILKHWHQLLVLTLELSGPIFVKLGQWGSTRRDLFSEDLCNALAKLQANNRPHSWYYTKKTLERAFGPNWSETFVLDNGGAPVGTGCCGQVYKAWIKPEKLHCKRPMLHGGCDDDRGNSLFVEIIERLGLGHFIPTVQPICVDSVENCKHLIPTAVKVLHPSMSTFLRRDLAIMKGAATALQWMVPELKWLSLPDCVDEFADLMRAQVDLNIEADNLERFAANFHDVDSVRFPKPIRSMTKPYLLVETFEEGESMFDYVTGHDVSQALKVELADIGMHAILKMVFQDNFIHGDLHPGNMLVQRRTPLSSNFWDMNIFRYIRNIILPILPALRLVVIDCGIIVSLSDKDKWLFREVFRGVADGKGRRVADLFLNNSTNMCHDPDRFRERITELVQMSIDKTVTLDQFAVASLMSQVFSTMVEYKVKMEGCFTSVVLAVMVVEGLGRSLDPSIDLVSKARPYLFKGIDIPKLLQHSKTLLS